MHILIIKTSSMGDIIHTLPALTDAISINPKLKFDWVVEESFTEIPSWHSAVTSVIPVALRRWRKHPFAAATKTEFKSFLNTLRAKKYELIIDAQTLLKSAIIANLAHGITAGLNCTSAREPLAALFYKKGYKISKQQHALIKIRELFAQALSYPLPTTAADYGIANQFQNNAPTEKYFLFIPNTARPEKNWSPQNWQQLLKRTTTQGHKIKIPWGTETEYNNAQLLANNNSLVEVLPKLTLTELARSLRSATAVVTVDTGLSHLAAALDVPAVVLYGPTNPQLIGTVGKNQIHLKAEDGSMAGITVAAVWEELQLIGKFF